MKALALVAVVLAGCGGREYRQAAAPASMPAPGFTAASGPRVGPIPSGPQPQRVPLPRSTGRELPARPEPTVYAANGAKPGELLGVILPPLAGAPDGLRDECAASMAATLKAVEPYALKARVVEEMQRMQVQRICLSARLYALCVQRRADEVSQRTLDDAAEYETRKCPKEWNTPEVERLFQVVRKRGLN